jgi:soluble cytochrome b562
MDENCNDALTVHLIVHKDSAEMFAHMTHVEEEKKAFKTLFDIRPSLF